MLGVRFFCFVCAHHTFDKSSVLVLHGTRARERIVIIKGKRNIYVIVHVEPICSVLCARLSKGSQFVNVTRYCFESRIAYSQVSLFRFEFNDSGWRYSWYELWLILDCNQGRLVGRRWWLGSGRRWRDFWNYELLKCWLVAVASTRHDSQWWSSVVIGFYRHVCCSWTVVRAVLLEWCYPWGKMQGENTSYS